jgi:hypothetical protein
MCDGYLIELLIFLSQQCHFPVLGIEKGQLLKRDKHKYKIGTEITMEFITA